MPLGNKKIKGILEKYKDAFEALENYDKTRTLPFQRKRVDITLSVETINKLKLLKEKTGKPISKIIEEKIEKRTERLRKRAKNSQTKSHFKPKAKAKETPIEQAPPAEPVPSYIR